MKNSVVSRIVSLVIIVALITIALPFSAIADCKVGDVGDDVRLVQKALCAAGYNVVVDGCFGPKTEAAVKRFEKAHGYTIDGVVDDATLAALKKALNANPTAWQSSTNNYASKTKSLLVVDLSNQTVSCYKGKSGSWKQVGPTVRTRVDGRVKTGQWTLNQIGTSKFISGTGLSGTPAQYVRELDGATKVVVKR